MEKVSGSDALIKFGRQEHAALCTLGLLKMFQHLSRTYLSCISMYHAVHGQCPDAPSYLQQLATTRICTEMGFGKLGLVLEGAGCRGGSTYMLCKYVLIDYMLSHMCRSERGCDHRGSEFSCTN